MTNIPIYRAKKIDSDEYVTGVASVLWDWINRESEDLNENELDEPIRRVVICGAYDNYADDDSWNFRSDFIDESTLSIHFPDMLDSQGNKIFASLSEDGKGGDIVQIGNISKIKTILKNGCIIGIHLEEYAGVKNLSWGNISRVYENDMKDIFNEFKTIGIKQ